MNLKEIAVKRSITKKFGILYCITDQLVLNFLRVCAIRREFVWNLACDIYDTSIIFLFITYFISDLFYHKI